MHSVSPAWSSRKKLSASTAFVSGFFADDPTGAGRLPQFWAISSHGLKFCGWYQVCPATLGGESRQARR
jgi:hypothetical protein